MKELPPFFVRPDINDTSDRIFSGLEMPQSASLSTTN